MSPTSRVVVMVFMTFVVLTFYFHMFLQHQYFVRCKSNVFQVVMFKRSEMCSTMKNTLLLIEDVFLLGTKRFIETNVLTIYRMFMQVLGLPMGSRTSHHEATPSFFARVFS